MAPKGLGSAVYLAQMFLSQVLGSGGTGSDATAGNGYDTLFLASLVGPGAKSMPLIFSPLLCRIPGCSWSSTVMRNGFNCFRPAMRRWRSSFPARLMRLFSILAICRAATTG